MRLQSRTRLMRIDDDSGWEQRDVMTRAWHDVIKRLVNTDPPQYIE